jgi:hypothetical protein
MLLTCVHIRFTNGCLLPSLPAWTPSSLFRLDMIGSFHFIAQHPITNVVFSGTLPSVDDESKTCLSLAS